MLRLVEREEVGSCGLGKLGVMTMSSFVGRRVSLFGREFKSKDKNGKAGPRLMCAGMAD